MIRFSHKDYEKFRRIHEKPPFTARLLQVFLLQDIHVSDEFREYDTKFYVGDMVQYYLLKGRLWLVLLLETEDGLLFTTMRTANMAKLQYYKDAQGEQFQIVARETHE
jgi:hypothetical protein